MHSIRSVTEDELGNLKLMISRNFKIRLQLNEKEYMFTLYARKYLLSKQGEKIDRYKEQLEQGILQVQRLYELFDIVWFR